MRMIFTPFHEVAEYIAPNVAEHHANMLDKDDYGTPNPDWEYYIALSQAGHCYCVSAVKDGKLIGYAGYTVANNPRYKHILQASSEAIYIEPEHRGVGLDMLRMADKELKALGVQEINYVWSDDRLAKILTKMGYKPKYQVWSKYDE